MASSIASLVPEPMEKCAVWAASPNSTVRPWRQVRVRTVCQSSHLELLPIRSWPSRWSANNDWQNAMLSRSFWPGTRDAGSTASRPARRHVASSHSTMKVLRSSVNG